MAIDHHKSANPPPVNTPPPATTGWNKLIEVAVLEPLNPAISMKLRQ
jgi:hypothetical protein